MASIILLFLQSIINITITDDELPSRRKYYEWMNEHVAALCLSPNTPMRRRRHHIHSTTTEALCRAFCRTCLKMVIDGKFSILNPSNRAENGLRTDWDLTMRPDNNFDHNDRRRWRQRWTQKMVYFQFFFIRFETITMIYMPHTSTNHNSKLRRLKRTKGNCCSILVTHQFSVE